MDGVAIGGDENADEGTQTRRVDPVVVGDQNRWLAIGVNNSDSRTLHFFLGGNRIVRSEKTPTKKKKKNCLSLVARLV